MKKTILLAAITFLVYACTPSSVEESKVSTDSLALQVDTLPVVCDTTICDTSCVDTTSNK